MANELTSTEYRFGHTKEHYGPELESIAKRRIEDASELLAELQPQIRYYPKDQNEEQRKLRLRVSQIEEAISTWRKILEIDSE